MSPAPPPACAGGGAGAAGGGGEAAGAWAGVASPALSSASTRISDTALAKERREGVGKTTVSVPSSSWVRVAPVAAASRAPLVATIPARAAVALGPSDDFADREDAARLAAQLRATLPPDARLLLVLESRSFYFRGLDFIPYHVLEGSPILRLVHEAADERDLRCRLAALGVTHVVVNLELARRFHPVPIAGYGAVEYTADLARLRRFLDAWAEPVARQGGVVAARLRSIDGCTGVSAPGTAVPKPH